MNYRVKKKIGITLELTQEEFNTIVASVGKTNQSQREEFGYRNDLRVLNEPEAHELYIDMKNLAVKLN